MELKGFAMSAHKLPLDAQKARIKRGLKRGLLRPGSGTLWWLPCRENHGPNLKNCAGWVKLTVNGLEAPVTSV
jgi:hypothetical protein